MADNEETNKQQARKRLEEARRLLASAPGGTQFINPAGDFEKLIDPHVRSLACISKQVENISSLLRPHSAFADLDKAFRIHDYSKTLMSSPALKLIQEQSTAMQDMLRSIEASSARWRDVMRSIESLTLGMKLPETAFAQFGKSALVWDSGLSEAMRRFSETNLAGLRSDLCIRLLEPSRVLSHFAEQTVSQIRAWSDDTRKLQALNASLALADAQHLANVDALCAFATEVADGEEVSATRALNAPFIQQAELLELPEIADEDGVEWLVTQSPAAQASERSRSILALATSCNKASRVRGGGDIFKPTTKVLQVFTDLPWLAPCDERTFGDFVDCLYFMLYEAAGKDKLRYLNNQGGPLETNDCRIIWCVKILRNKWLRHDADHGKESEIRKSWNDLDSHLQWLGASTIPCSAEEFRRLHARLTSEVETFLKLLLGKFR